MPEPICLTPDEEEGLRMLLAALATFEDRMYDPEKQMYLGVTRQTWNGLFDPAKAKLRRIVTRRLESPDD